LHGGQNVLFFSHAVARRRKDAIFRQSGNQLRRTGQFRRQHQDAQYIGKFQ
jgi:hypothetical protein